MSHARRILPALLVVGCLGACPRPAAAQEQALPHASTAAELDRLQWERNRELMHPGRPLGIVGLEQEDNGFRERAPGLEHSDRAVVLVDAEESYRRRLAMYSQGATFHRAPRALARASLSLPVPSEVPHPPDVGAAGEPESASPALPLGLGLVLVTVFLALLFKARAGRTALRK